MPSTFFTAMSEEDWEKLRMGALSEADKRAMEQVVGSQRTSVLAALLGRGPGHADLTRAGLYSTRPATAEGRVTFSFQHRTVARRTARRQPPSGRVYLERSARTKLAPEALREAGAHFDRRMSVGGSAGAYYVPTGTPPPPGVRPAATGDIGDRPMGWAAGAGARRQRYIERERAVEEDDGERLSIGNIADTLTERAAFWEAVEARERYGGRIQSTITAELPYEPEVGSAGRRRIVAAFGAALEELGLCWHGVVHVPDEHSDARNFHLHLHYHDRPAQCRGDGSWWFSDWKAPETRDRNFIRELRDRYAEVVNAELERAGIHRRFDPRRYEQMGIEKKPTAHLGVAAAALERRGVVTRKGFRNAGREALFRLQQVGTAAARRVERDAALVRDLRAAFHELSDARHPVVRSACANAAETAKAFAEISREHAQKEIGLGVAQLRASDLIRRAQQVADHAAEERFSEEANRILPELSNYAANLRTAARRAATECRRHYRRSRTQVRVAVRELEAERLLVDRARTRHQLERAITDFTEERPNEKAWKAMGAATEQELRDARVAAGRSAARLAEMLVAHGLVPNSSTAETLTRSRSGRRQLRILLQDRGNEETQTALQQLRLAEKRLARATAGRARRTRIDMSRDRRRRHVMSNAEEDAHKRRINALRQRLDAVDRKVAGDPTARLLAKRRGLQLRTAPLSETRRRVRRSGHGR